jgi:hypothetical protein
MELNVFECLFIASLKTEKKGAMGQPLNASSWARNGFSPLLGLAAWPLATLLRMYPFIQQHADRRPFHTTKRTRGIIDQTIVPITCVLNKFPLGHTHTQKAHLKGRRNRRRLLCVTRHHHQQRLASKGGRQISGPINPSIITSIDRVHPGKDAENGGQVHHRGRYGCRCVPKEPASLKPMHPCMIRSNAWMAQTSVSIERPTQGRAAS